MALISSVVRSLPERILEQTDTILTDGDNTLFVAGTDELYPEVYDALSHVCAAQFSLVSANPDRALANVRASRLAEVLPSHVEVSAHIPRRAVWNKYSLYRQAAAGSRGDRLGFTVIGDRWLMDVKVGELAIARAYPQAHIEAFCVRRRGYEGDLSISPYIRRAEHLGFMALPTTIQRILVENYIPRT